MTWVGAAWIALSLGIGWLLWQTLGPVTAGAVAIGLFVVGALIAQRLRR